MDTYYFKEAVTRYVDYQGMGRWISDSLRSLPGIDSVDVKEIGKGSGLDNCTIYIKIDTSFFERYSKSLIQYYSDLLPYSFLNPLERFKEREDIYDIKRPENKKSGFYIGSHKSSEIIIKTYSDPFSLFDQTYRGILYFKPTGHEHFFKPQGREKLEYDTLFRKRNAAPSLEPLHKPSIVVLNLSDSNEALTKRLRTPTSSTLKPDYYLNEIETFIKSNPKKVGGLTVKYILEIEKSRGADTPSKQTKFRSNLLSFLKKSTR